jgi:outer membrane protein TolC
MRKLFAIFITLLFATSNIEAQQTYTISECVQYALKNHNNIKMSKNDFESAIAKKNEGRSGYLPQVNGQIKWDDNLILQTTVLPAGTFGPGTPEQRIQIGNQYNTIAGIQLDQTLFNMSYIEGIRALKPNEELNKLKIVKSEEEVIYNTVAAYYQIYLLQENEKLLNESKARIEKTLPIVKLQYEKGVARKIDVDRIQVNLNNILANKEILSINKDVALNNLKYNMGMPLDSMIQIDTNYSKEIVDFSNTINDADDRIEIKILKQSLVLNQINYNRQKASYYPTVGFYAKYAGNAFGNKFSESFTKWTQLASIGLQVNIPIFDGLRNSSTLKQMSLKNENIKLDIAQTQEAFKLQMLNAKTNISNSIKNLDINKQNLELAKNILDVTTTQYQKGVIAYSEVISAEFSYREAESNYMQSLVKYLSSKLDLDKSNNNLNIYK